MSRIAFTKPYLTGLESEYFREALMSGVWQGDGGFTARATSWLEDYTGAPHALLTTSCTHALELAAMLLRLGPGDEVIVPSFTFTSTATAVAIRGAVPVFVDIDPVTLNVDPALVEAAITEHTRAIFVVHYGGVAADMPALLSIAKRHGLDVVEDNAHALGASLNGKHLGTFGTLATQSWHATKNVACGEGGALLINDGSLLERAEMIREKGTNRARFLRGAVDKYTWVDQGSSYLPADLLAAVLMAQLERFDEIQRLRHQVWDRYSADLQDWTDQNGVATMNVRPGVTHPAHLFYLMMPSSQDQEGLISHLAAQDIAAVFHYQPLDSAPAGRELGYTPEPCTVTADAAARLVRLPLHAGLTDADLDRVVSAVVSYTPLA
jgi:dTDP-4-amino-4,6-dideoxygalactose transaminase